MTARPFPEAGDIVWLRFDPQAGRRPAIVASPAASNGKISLTVCCPITTKGYPFEVTIAGTGGGVVLADQVKNLDWRACGATRKDRVSDAELAEVRTKTAALIGG